VADSGQGLLDGRDAVGVHLSADGLLEQLDAQDDPGKTFLSRQDTFATFQRSRTDVHPSADLQIGMRIIWELRGYEPPDRVDLCVGDRSRLAVKHDESYGSVRSERFIVAAIVINVDEKVVLEKRLLHDLIAIAPTAANFVGWQKGLDSTLCQILKNLFLVARPGVKRIPTRHRRPEE